MQRPQAVCSAWIPNPTCTNRLGCWALNPEPAMPTVAMAQLKYKQRVLRQHAMPTTRMKPPASYCLTSQPRKLPAVLDWCLYTRLSAVTPSVCLMVETDGVAGAWAGLGWAVQMAACIAELCLLLLLRLLLKMMTWPPDVMLSIIHLTVG